MTGWHTGIPIKEGWYLCSTKASDFSVHHYDGNKWDFCPLDFVVAWQKIKSYKEDQMDDDWHEGKPEEKGQYLVYCDDKTGADVDYFLDGEWQFHKDHVKAWKNIYVPLWLLED